jgi:hypothetical protein
LSIHLVQNHSQRSDYIAKGLGMAHPKIIVLVILTLLKLAVPSAAAEPPTFIGLREYTAVGAAPATTGDIELASHTGGIVSGLAVQGNYAYIGISSELAVLDISAPDHPLRVGSVVLSERVQRIVVADQYVYAATYAGLHVIDVSNPTLPIQLGALSINVEDIAVANKYLYVANGNSLSVVDVSTPSLPVVLASVAGLARRVAVAGFYLYVASENVNRVELRAMSILNPAAPIVVGTYSSAPITSPDKFGAIAGLTVSGSNAYLTFDRNCCTSPLNGLIVNISNPASLKLVGALPSSASNVDILGQYAYLADRNILRVFDITRTDRPIELAAYTMPRGYYAQTRGLPLVKAVGRYLYYAAEDALEVVDLAIPAAPSVVGAFITLTYADSAVVAGHYAYANALYGGLQILDIADPTNPVRVGWLPGLVEQLTIAGQYAYLVMGGNPGDLQVVDISAPAEPRVVGRLDNKPGARIYSMAVAGSYLYLADQFNGLRIIDISTPSAPTEVAILAGHAFSITISGAYAYVVSDQQVVQIVDISDPSAPTKVGTIPGFGDDVAVSGQYAYLVRYASPGFQIFDISNPSVPVEVAVLQIKGSSVAIQGRYAYVGDAFQLQVIDIANPAAPLAVGTYPLAPCGNCFLYPSILTLANGYAYLSQGDGGLFSFRFGKSIAGRITHANSLPAPLAGVTISAGVGLTATTDLSGTYQLDNISGGSHILTAALAGYRFWPASRSVTTTSDARGQDFVALTSPVSATLTPDAPTGLTSLDTQGLSTQLAIPAGAVAAGTTLVFTPTVAESTHGWAFAGHAFDLAASQSGTPMPNLLFSAPVTATISYSDGDARLVSTPANLALWWWNGSGWQDAAATCSPATTYARDLIMRTISVALCRTGRFALFGPTQQVYLPQ